MCLAQQGSQGLFQALCQSVATAGLKRRIARNELDNTYFSLHRGTQCQRYDPLYEGLPIPRERILSSLIPRGSPNFRNSRLRHMDTSSPELRFRNPSLPPAGLQWDSIFGNGRR